MSAHITNQIGDRAIIDEKFKGRNKPTRDTRQESLRKNTQQRTGQLNAYLGLLVGRERINNTIHGLTGGVSMQSGKHQVSGLGRSYRRRDCFRIAHFTDHQDIGILTRNSLESRMEIGSVKLHFALINNRFLGLKNVFNRILNGDNVLKSFQIDGLYHGGKSGGLAHSGRTHHQEKALLTSGKSFENWR